MWDFGTDIINDDDDRTKVGLSFNDTLHLTPSDEFISYLVSLKYFKGDNDKESKCLDYTIGLEYLNEDPQILPHVFRVYKKDLFFNKKKPSLIIEEITTAIAATMYPLEIAVDNSGSFIEVLNYTEIQKRWIINKKNIIKEYKGDLVFKMVKKFENIIKTPSKLEASLSNEIFWSIFYNPIYTSYQKDYKKESTVVFPLEPYKPLAVYKGISTITPFITEYNTIELKYSGQSIISDPSRFHIKRTGHTISSDLQITYDLDTDTRMPRLINVICDVYDETKKEEIKAIALLVVQQESDTFPKSSLEKKEDQQPESPEIQPKKKRWFFSGSKK
ncbi:hypothetical protein [Aquimarina longa]|uniref:hypothetical protein n=1 Tax=Aquimarina longa TaxID=1080221 RepID=UPI0007813362|nr:hypothetical protein [Aquimarina longa]